MFFNHFSGYIDGLGDAVELGLVKAVGVSNYNGIFTIYATIIDSILLIECAKSATTLTKI